MTKDINKTEFDESTKLKLDIFGECFEEWLPVFNNDLYTENIYIFDFFAGSGQDSSGNWGTPLILLKKAKGKERKYCSNAKKKIHFIFNEGKKRKSKELDQNVKDYIEKCKEENNCSSCKYDYSVENDDFKNVFSNRFIINILNDSKCGKFILLDQYGFKEINEDIFKQLISCPKTDFIFFISSSFISRFREHPNTIKHIDTSRIDFENFEPKEIHRAIADYFRSLIPEDKEYYLHHFSIRKENQGNYYGLIFGSNHTLGMEKFLKVCWKFDSLSGEANFNIDNNFGEYTLFHSAGYNVKKDCVKKELEELILDGKIINNIQGLKLALKKGCEPKLFTEVVKSLETSNKIERLGELNYSSTNIHKVKEYQIKVINHDS